MAKPTTLEITYDADRTTQTLLDCLPRCLLRQGEVPSKVHKIKTKNVWKFTRHITIIYQITFVTPGGDKIRQQYVGYIVKPEVVESYYQQVFENAEVTPEIGRAVTLIPEANLVLAAYPNELKMTLLQDIDVTKWLQKNIGQINGMRAQEVEFLESTVEKLRYVPGKRFTSRCKVQFKNKLTGDIKTISFIAKQFGNEAKARQLFQSLKSLEKALAPHIGTRSGDAPAREFPARIPRALGLIAKKRAVFIEEMHGRNLKESLANLDLEKAMFGAGAVLANFHKADLRVGKTVTRQNEIIEVRDTFSLMKKLCPQLRRQIDTFYTKFQQIDWQDGAPDVLLHGSYRMNHIFIQDGEFVLLDLDSIRTGHPSYDIANFLSSLFYLEAQERFSSEMNQQIQVAFLRGYQQHTDFHIRPDAVLWFLSSLIVNKKASKYMTHEHADRDAKVEMMLGVAQKILDYCDTSSGVASLEQVGEILSKIEMDYNDLE